MGVANVQLVFKVPDELGHSLTVEAARWTRTELLQSGVRVVLLMELWHYPMARQFHCLTKMAGVLCAMEVRGLIIDSEARPDLVLFIAGSSQVGSMTDVRTADMTGLKGRFSAAARAGVAEVMSEMLKNKKWLPLSLSQNPRFVPLVIEPGGRLGDAALGFIE